MNIAFLTPEFPHPKTGFTAGIGTSIKNLIQGLQKEGHQITLLIYGQNDDELFIENGITFHKIKNVKLRGLSRFLTQKKIEKLINSLVRSNKIDIVEAPDWTGITANIKPICPIVIKLHGSAAFTLSAKPCHVTQSRA